MSWAYPLIEALREKDSEIILALIEPERAELLVAIRFSGGMRHQRFRAL